jgi:hypothetical protein
MNRKCSAFWILALFLAGCTSEQQGLQDPTVDVEETPPSEANQSVPSKDAPVLEAQPASAGFAFDDCYGLRGLIYLPASSIEATPPADWQPSPTGIVQVKVIAMECARASIGQLERGPASFVLETHNNHSPAGNCTSGDYTSSETLRAFWASDQVFVNALGNLGIPSQVAIIRAQTDSAGLVSRQFSFGLQDGPLSEIQIYNLTRPADQYEEATTRLFWGNPSGGISLMDFELGTYSDALEPQTIFGAINEPFLFAQTKSPAFGAYGGGFVNSHVRAMSKSFGDSLCNVSA